MQADTLNTTLGEQLQRVFGGDVATNGARFQVVNFRAQTLSVWSNVQNKLITTTGVVVAEIDILPSINPKADTPLEVLADMREKLKTTLAGTSITLHQVRMLPLHTV